MLYLPRRCASVTFRLIECQRLAARAIASHPRRFSEIEDRWRDRDGVPHHWELVYKAPIDHVIRAFATFVTVSSGVLIGCGVYYTLTPHDPNAPIVLGSSDVVIANDLNEFLIYVVAFVVFHIVVKIFIARFVIRMYKNDDKYLAVFRGHLYNQIRKHEFQVKDFKRLKMPNFVSWGDSRFSLGTRKAILLEDYFKTPRHLSSMLVKKPSVDSD